jgi:uncharacterized membrane protein HdeD (DUF308 family)
METTEQQQQIEKASKKKEVSAWVIVGLGALIVFNSYAVNTTATLLSTVAGILIYHGVMRTRLAKKFEVE